MFGDEGVLVGGEGGGDGVEERGQGGVASLGQVVVLDGAEGGLDLVQVGAVGRQVVEVDAPRPEGGAGGAGFLTAMDRAVVQHDHGRDRHRRQVGQEGDEVLAAQAAGLGDPVEGRVGARLHQGGEGVDAPPFGVLVGDALALALPHPGGGHRLAGREAAFVEVDEPDAAGVGLFLSDPSTAFARSTLAGSCLCRKVWTVRRQPAPIPRRYRRVWRGLRSMPRSASAAASWAEVQVRSSPSSRSSAASTRSRRAVSGGGPGGFRRRPAGPDSRKRTSTARTVAVLYPRCAATRGGPQPAADSSAISTRSRSAGERVGSRRRLSTATRPSVVSVRRIMHKSLAYPRPAA